MIPSELIARAQREGVVRPDLHPDDVPATVPPLEPDPRRRDWPARPSR